MRAHRQPARTNQPSRVRTAAHRAERARQALRSASQILALQRTVGNAAVTSSLDDTSVEQVLRTAGRPLDPPMRQEMEDRLGVDFSDVRLHTGSAAQRSAAEVGARAYTSGSHVVLGAAGVDGRTLAHELTHVIQQRSGLVPGTDAGSGLRISDPGDPYERAAENNAARVMAGSPREGRPHGDHGTAQAAGRFLQRARWSQGVEQSGAEMADAEWTDSGQATFASLFYNSIGDGMVDLGLVRSTSTEHAEDVAIRLIEHYATSSDRTSRFSTQDRNELILNISKSPCTSTARGGFPRTSKNSSGCAEKLIGLVTNGVPGSNGEVFRFTLRVICRGLYAPNIEGFDQRQVLRASELALNAMRDTDHISAQTDVRPGPSQQRFEAAQPAPATTSGA